MKQSKKNPAKTKAKFDVAAKPASKAAIVKTIATKPTKAPAKKAVKETSSATQIVAVRKEITTEIISARAYTLWEQAGRPQGRDLEYWLQAEAQLKQETQALAA